MIDALVNHDAVVIARLMAEKQYIPSRIAAAFVDTILAREADIEVFANFDAQLVRKQAAGLDVRPGGKLWGVPVGIKDVFDTEDYTTEFFSPIYRGRRTAKDARIVSMLRDAGALVMGKTHTAEFAYMHTGPTRNPHDLRRTPGSSSAGSAAGVAAGFFPLAIGTQTGASILKPASYCGVYGFKPTYGAVALDGVRQLAPSFDTVGWFGRSVSDIFLLAETLMPSQAVTRCTIARPRIGVCRTAGWSSVDVGVQQSFDTAVRKLIEQGLALAEVAPPLDTDEVCGLHQIINDVEGARSCAQEAASRRDLISIEMIDLINRAQVLPNGAEDNARHRLEELRSTIRQLMDSFDCIVSISCPTVAPLGLRKTGPSDLIKFWTAFGLPQLNIPIIEANTGLPIGLQMIGKPGRDAELLEIAAHVAAIVT